MILQLLLFQILIFLSSQANILAQPLALLQPNSPSTLRNVTMIWFLFEIEADCYCVDTAVNARHRPTLDFRPQNEAVKEYFSLEKPYISFSQTSNFCRIVVIRSCRCLLPGIPASSAKEFNFGLENPQAVQGIMNMPMSTPKLAATNISSNGMLTKSSSSWRNSQIEFGPIFDLGERQERMQPGLRIVRKGWEIPFMTYPNYALSNDSTYIFEGFSFSYDSPVDSQSLSATSFYGLFVIVAATNLGVLFLVIGRMWLSIIVKKIKGIILKRKFFKRNGGLLLQQLLGSCGVVDRCKVFNSKELENATNNFNVNRILGQGGQGTVYKGMLEDGRIIAVKKSKVIDEEKLEEFINELIILSQINHRNVVKLLGCCLETEVPLLVYEFIPNGTLFPYIHDQHEEFPLTWEMRLRIAIEVAGALSYLHSTAAIPIYHRDIKSTNVLLDEKYRAKVADFGTSKVIAIDQTHVTTKILGTLGYLDLEYHQSSQLTDKSDVYSFGVVLAELLTGKKPIFSPTSQENISLVTYFIRFMKQNHLNDILDDQVMESMGKKNDQIIAFANLARRCLDPNGRKRPTMEEVSTELKGIRALKKKRSAMFSKIIQRLSFKEMK